MAQKIRITIHRLCLISSLLFCTVGCDQVAKQLVRDSVPITGPLSYFNGHVQIEYARNPGAFMNLGADLSSGVRFWFFNVICAGILLGVAIALFAAKKFTPLTVLGLTLILGGGLGNLIDRFLFGSVTDFLFIRLGPFHTGVFNLADMAIVGGVLSLAIKARREQQHS